MLTGTTVLSGEEVASVLNAIGLADLDFRRLLSSLLLFLCCYTAMRVLLKLLDKTMARLHVERSLHAFIRSVARVLFWLLLTIIVAGYIGVPVSSLVALLGVVGLAVSLSIQGTLSNLAGGVMLLVSKPFTGGDHIETETFSGLVSEVGMVYTKVTTFDNKVVSIPNGIISGEKITNHSAAETRRVDVVFVLPYSAEPKRVSQCLLDMAGRHPKSLFSPDPFARTTSYLDYGVEYTLRVWCATGDYWDLYYDLLEQGRQALSELGIPLACRQMNVHLVEKV